MKIDLKRITKEFPLIGYLKVLTFLTFAFSIYFFYKFLQTPIYDYHGFRQAQTAISARYISKPSDIFFYKTPVFGPPWSIPFEAPIYQTTSKILSVILDIDLDVAGRVTSIFFFYLCIMVSLSLLKIWKANENQRLIFLILVLSSPIYLFWSRTFMMESTALFFSLLYTLLFFKAENKKSTLVLLFCIVAGTLGALTKVTTFLLYALLVSLFSLKTIIPFDKKKWAYTLKIILILTVPIIIFSIWNHHADSLKLSNPMANGFIDSQSLKRWNFGTVDQRFSLNTWIMFIERINSISFPLFLLLIPIWFKLTSNKNLIKFALILIICFIAPFLIFTNLYYVHEYYPYANGILFILAISLALGEWFKKLFLTPI